MKKVVFLLFWMNICTALLGQSGDLFLELSDPSSNGEKNSFSLQIDSYYESRLKEISGKKFEIHSSDLAFNGSDLEIKSIKTRGKSTLFFTRKSFSISLIEPVILDSEEIKKLALNNLAMDRNYYRNRLSFLMLDRIGIFKLQNKFTELQINGRSAGLYLAIQKPEDFIHSLDSPLLVRREYEGRFTIEDAQGDHTKQQIKRLRNIPKLTKRYAGQQLYDSLNTVVHMEHYFQWLAFNYLIQNGDYTDELFLYLKSDENRFDIIPWDYDDIFMRQPHDGFEKRNKILDHKLLFSGEAYLDIVIDSDNVLYMKFLDSFREILEILYPDFIKQVFENVYAELYPYYTDQEIIAQSEYDYFGHTDLSILKADLQNHYQGMIYQRISIQRIIDSELLRISQENRLPE